MGSRIFTDEWADGTVDPAGHRHLETMPAIHEVGGVMLPRPFKIVKHGPVNIFVHDVDRAREFYTNELGFKLSEERTAGSTVSEAVCIAP